MLACKITASGAVAALALGAALSLAGAAGAEKKASASKGPVYKDPAAAVDARVQDLLARMTLEEKVA